MPFERNLAAWVFAAALVGLSLHGHEPTALKAHPVLLKSLLSGNTQGYILPGSELEPFKNSLPNSGSVSFLTDQAFGVNQDEEKFLYDAQSYLAPLVLNTEPGEALAVVYCSTQASADSRLQATGYSWLHMISDGKGIAQK